MDTTLVAAIRAGHVSRVTLVTIDNGDEAKRLWSGRGDLAVDGVTYSGTTEAAIIAISGISNTAALQSHEVTISINAVAAKEIGLGGYSARGASVTVAIVYVYGDGTIHAARKTLFSGKIQSSEVAISGDGIGVTYRCRPPLLDMSRNRITRYTSADQARRYAGDTGFDDVAGLVNKAPVAWKPSTATAEGDIFVEWSISGGVVTLQDTAGRNVIATNGAGGMLSIECGSSDALGTRDGAVVSGQYGQYKKVPLHNSYQWYDYAASVKEYYQFGFGSSVSPAESASPASFIGPHRLNSALTSVVDSATIATLNADGFVYAGGSRVVVSQSNNRVYAASGALIHIIQLRMAVPAGVYADIPAPSPLCGDVSGLGIVGNFRFVAFDVNTYLEAQAV